MMPLHHLKSYYGNLTIQTVRVYLFYGLSDTFFLSLNGHRKGVHSLLVIPTSGNGAGLDSAGVFKDGDKLGKLVL